MNTIRSTYYGWGALIVAGATSYYYAKQAVNEDRQGRHQQEMKRRKLVDQLEARERLDLARPKSVAHSNAADHAASPSSEASLDPAPTRHTPPAPAKGNFPLPTPPEKGKYEPTEVYTSKKGDRFS